MHFCQQTDKSTAICDCLRSCRELVRLSPKCASLQTHTANFDIKYTLTADGYFYSTVEHLENETCLSGHEQRKAVAVLTELNILKVVSKGIPAKRHFKINFEVIADVFAKLDKSTSKARNSQKLKILTASDKEIETQAEQNFDTNNKIYYNIQGLKDYINNLNLNEEKAGELEEEFTRLDIAMTDDYVEILSKTAYQRLLFMRASIASDSTDSVFCFVLILCDNKSEFAFLRCVTSIVAHLF